VKYLLSADTKTKFQWLIVLLGFFALPTASFGQSDEITFHKDIEPILQRSCQNCHRPGGAGPMPLISYDEVAPFAGLIEYKTGIRDRAGAMPPWYVEKRLGIQDFKDDPSLNDEEIAAISTWARNGTPQGDPADAPEPLVFESGTGWTLGEPDLVIKTEDVTKLAGTPDWWGELPSVPITGMEQDRYVKSVEIIEVNDVDLTAAGDTAIGGRYVFHHLAWSTTINEDPDSLIELISTDDATTFWPVHELGRNPDIFDADSGRLLHAGSTFIVNSVHLHSNGRDTTGHLEFGFRFHPVGYKPKYEPARIALGNGVDISIGAGDTGRELEAFTVLQDHTKIVTFEPHLHAPGERMCLEAIWGHSRETLTCAGYDHNWVRGYAYGENAAPLLPKGTILRITGYMNNSETNTNLQDTRNWQGSGNRSVANMFIDLGIRLKLSDEQFLAEMENRREVLNLGPNDHVIGCPLCLTPLVGGGFTESEAESE